MTNQNNDFMKQLEDNLEQNDDSESLEEEVGPSQGRREEERQQMVTNANQLIATISQRRAEVESLLEEVGKADWEAIRSQSCSQDRTGAIPCNSVLRNLRIATEPVRIRIIFRLIPCLRCCSSSPTTWWPSGPR